MTKDVEIALQVEDRCVFRMSLTTHPHALDILREYIRKYDHVRNKQIIIGDAANFVDYLRATLPWEERA